MIDVVQRGYLIGERLLRPAMVTVARGAPQAAGGDKEDDAEGGSDEPGSTVNTTA